MVKSTRIILRMSCDPLHPNKPLLLQLTQYYHEVFKLIPRIGNRTYETAGLLSACSVGANNMRHTQMSNVHFWQLLLRPICYRYDSSPTSLISSVTARVYDWNILPNSNSTPDLDITTDSVLQHEQQRWYITRSVHISILLLLKR